MELKSFVALDDDGNVLNAALCHVYMRGTEMLVGGLQRPTGMPLSNPFNTDDLGQFQFAAPDGLYDLRVRKGLRDYRCLLYTSPSPRDKRQSRMPSSA